jgi:DNA repair protein RadA/Sms
MLATKTQFVCQECGAAQPKWHGRCPSCSAWGSMVEEAQRPAGRRGAAVAGNGGRRPQPLAEVEAVRHDRLPSGIEEFDRVLGGGLVPGSLVLIGGDPGIGKSTLTTMALARLATRQPVLLVCGEESPAQVRMRAERIGGAGRIGVVAETDLEVVCQTLVQEQPAVAVIDSIQTLWANDLSSAPGSVAQVREAAGRLLRVAKEHAITVVLVGHVTKDGTVAGPRVLEHLVDVVLLFEGDRTGDLRVLRAAKNRFGSTAEIGVFEMTATGLAAVGDPSALLGRGDLGGPGSVVACAVEGTRPLLLEVQALVAPSELPMPRRLATGVDRNRLAMILAVLQRHAELPFGSADVFAIALAIASAQRGLPTGPLVAFGEIGLTGRLRAVPQAERRLREAQRLGLTHALAPGGTLGVAGTSLRTAQTVAEAIAVTLPAGP